VCAAEGYPGAYRKGDIIKVPPNTGNTSIYHAGTTVSSIDASERLYATGGRVLAVTGLGATLSSARKAAYNAVAKIEFQGMHYRKDIGHRALQAPIRIGVLGSTRGSSLQPIIDSIESGGLNAKISVCISDKADAAILERAKKHSIPAISLPYRKNREDFDDAVTAKLEEHNVDLVLFIGNKPSLTE
jgi:formyltetrahydrofolate hydrolase